MTTASVAFPQLSLRLPPDPISARRGRSALRLEVARWGHLDRDQLDVLELLASELITNSLLHTDTPVLEVTATQDHRGVCVTVTDADCDRPVRLRSPGTLAGRGLVLVDALADTWGVDYQDDGKAVWFRLDRAQARLT